MGGWAILVCSSKGPRTRQDAIRAWDWLEALEDEPYTSDDFEREILELEKRFPPDARLEAFRADLRKKFPELFTKEKRGDESEGITPLDSSRGHHIIYFDKAYDLAQAAEEYMEKLADQYELIMIHDMSGKVRLPKSLRPPTLWERFKHR